MNSEEMEYNMSKPVVMNGRRYCNAICAARDPRNSPSYNNEEE